MANYILANSVVTTNKKDADLIYLGCLIVQAIEELTNALTEDKIQSSMSKLLNMKERFVNVMFDVKLN